MSPAHSILKSNVMGTFFKMFAEPVTFRGESVNAQINRMPNPPDGVSVQIDTTVPRGVKVLLPPDLDQPEFDEVIAEAGGAKHRIKENAQNLGYAWLCDCETV